MTDTLPKRWRANDGSFFFTINLGLEEDSAYPTESFLDVVMQSDWKGAKFICDACYYNGLYFKTREEAQAMADKIRAVLNPCDKVQRFQAILDEEIDCD